MPKGYIEFFSSAINDWHDKGAAKPQRPPSFKEPFFTRILSYLKLQGSKRIKDGMTKVSDVSQTSIQLTSLPTELLLMIISHFDMVNQVFLQVICRFFRAFIIVDRVALECDRCRKWAITCFLEQDMDKYPAKVACAFCKTVRPKKTLPGF